MEMDIEVSLIISQWCLSDQAKNQCKIIDNRNNPISQWNSELGENNNSYFEDFGACLNSRWPGEAYKPSLVFQILALLWKDYGDMTATYK